MKVEQPENFLIQSLNDIVLWKYLDLYKLIDLLQKQQLHFTRFDHFEDRLEGITGRDIDRLGFIIDEPLTKENINPTFSEEEQNKLISWHKRNTEHIKSSVALTQETQFCCCWFQGDRESIAMWKLYSDDGGVAIRFNGKELVSQVLISAEAYSNTDFTSFYYGPVEYKNIWPIDLDTKFKNKFNGLKKDNSYRHESEFRFVAVVDPKKRAEHIYFKLPIGPISSFQIEIIANPFMPQWKYDNLKQLLKVYDLGDRLQKSKMVIRR
jgi:hypothetical protein